MTTKRQHLAELRRVFDPEMVQFAQLAFPDRERETEAQRIERERIETDRTARAMAMRETRDEIIAGKYGKEAKQKATEFAVSNGKDSEATLKYCSELAAKERKREHYKRLAISRKREID